MLKRLVAVGALLCMLLLASCSGLSSFLEEQAARINSDIDTLGKTLQERRSDYDSLKADAENWAFYAPYAEKEQWIKKFDSAKSSLASLRERFDSDVQPILDADKPEDDAKLEALLKTMEANVKSVRTEIFAVRDRMALLQEAQEKAPKWVEAARSNVATINAQVTGLATLVERTKQSFPERSADIDTRLQPLLGLQQGANDALKVAEAEFAKHSSGQNADYAAFADAYKLTLGNAREAQVAEKSYREQLASLSREYSLILRDMKIEYAVQIGRSSWDNDSDWDTNRNALYNPVSISKKDYMYLASLPQGERDGAQGNLACQGCGWGSGTQVYIDSVVWKNLGINPKASWPRGHNLGMFWIEDLYPVYYHRYAEVNGTKAVEGEWEEVDEVDYARHVEDFGMAIETKRLGQFADEAVEEATPPGMDMVGDPRYGTWTTGTDGRQQWSWLEAYGFYALMFGGTDRHYYYRDDYRNYGTWRDDRRRGAGTHGWYGTNRSKPVYGTTGSHTTQTASYKSSPFKKAGGINAVPKSLRDAGRAARNRGPGNAGK